MDATVILDGLRKWLLTFELEVRDDITDGITVAQCLHQLDPGYFSNEWLHRLVPDCEGNVVLKTNNLKKIIRRIVDYFHELHHIELVAFPVPEAGSVAQGQSEKDLAHFLQLLLGVAIHSEKKQIHVQAIRNMDESIQMIVMSALQELLNGCQQKAKSVSGEEYHEMEDRLRDALEKVVLLQGERDELAQAKFDLEKQAQIKDEEIIELRADLRAKEVLVQPGTPQETKIDLHRRELDQVRREKLMEEAMKEEYRMRAEEAEQHLQEVIQKNRELSSRVDSMAELQDQVDEMRHLEEKVAKYEQQISSYRIKLEDIQDLRRQMRSLEDKNTMYVQQNLDLEEELRRVSSVKVQITTHKQRIQELERRMLEESTHRQSLQHDLEQSQDEARQLRSELEQSQSAMSPVKNVSLGSEISGREGIDFSSPQSSFLTEVYTPELKEKMARLEKENCILKNRLDSPSGETDLELVATKTELELTQEKLKRMESHLRESTPSSVASSAGDKDLLQKIRRLEEDSESKNVEIEKLKKYLKKAKKIIEGFGGGSNLAEDGNEMSTLKQQLQEKEIYIQKLEKQLEEHRELKEREERMIVTAWYDIGMQMFQQKSEQRLTSSLPFLAQQRRALFSRRVAMAPFGVSSSQKS